MLLAVRLLQYGLFFGEIGIAGFILDHEARYLRAVWAAPTGTARRQKNPEKKVDDIGDEKIKNESKETEDHLSTVAESMNRVNDLRWPCVWAKTALV